MSEVIARLEIHRGPEPGTSFSLAEEVVRIGRGSGSDIIIQDPEVSRVHAQLVRQPDGYAIQDLGSTNGTFVNYERVTGLTALAHGDVIAFGDAIVLAYWDESATASQPIPPPVIREQPDPEPVPAPSASAPAYKAPMFQAEPIVPPVPQRPPLTEADYVAQTAARRRRIIIGCGAGFLILICLCMGALFFLDGYQQGRLLYCGGLRPFWELILGPFGFNPACP